MAHPTPQRDRGPARAAGDPKIKASFDANHGTYGYRRVHAALVRGGEQASPELVRRLMRQAGLVACQPRPWRKTTIAGEGPAAAPDLVARDFTATQPGTKLVGDITYIRTWAGWLYLATVIDCFNKEVIGYAMADHMRTELVTDARRWPHVTTPSPRAASFTPIAGPKANSSGRRNTSTWRCSMARRQQAADRAQRPKMRSPGRWGFPRRVERDFWRRIAQGLRTAEAAETVGVSEVIGGRWFREGGGMPPMTLTEPTAVICRSSSGKKSRSCGRRATAHEKSVAGSGVMHRPSLASFAATRPRGLQTLGIGPQPRSGRPRSQQSARRKPSC